MCVAMSAVLNVTGLPDCRKVTTVTCVLFSLIRDRSNYNRFGNAL